MKRNQSAGYSTSVGMGLNLLTDSDLEHIHISTLEVLEQSGIFFECEEARRILKQAGAKVEGEIVKFPAYMVEEAIRSAPGSLLLAGRDPENDLRVC